MNFVLEFPKFYNPIVCGKHLKNARFVVDKLDSIYLLVQLYGLEVVALRLMTLYLSKVPVIKVSRVLELVILENYDTTSLIAYCQIFACLVVSDRCENVVL